MGRRIRNRLFSVDGVRDGWDMAWIRALVGANKFVLGLFGGC